MTHRDIAIWSAFIFFLILGGIIGLIRGRAIMRAYLAINADLRRAGIELSREENKILIKCLGKNPQKAISDEPSSVAREIKQPHVEKLLATTKPLKRIYWVLLILSGTAFISAINLWPAPTP